MIKVEISNVDNWEKSIIFMSDSSTVCVLESLDELNDIIEN
jgi:hypothetical protein